jgi:hypothetical protein
MLNKLLEVLVIVMVNFKVSSIFNSTTTNNDIICDDTSYWFSLIALMMEAARSSETLVNFYQTTRCYNPEDSHLRTHRRENLKSYLEIEMFIIIKLWILVLWTVCGRFPLSSVYTSCQWGSPQLPFN